MQLKRIFCAVLYFAVINSSYGQLPELGSASLTGAPTTARFLAGASPDDGASFANSFAFDQALDLLTEIQVEAGHVGTVGNLYVLIQLDGLIFMGQSSGGFAVWDGTLPGLEAIRERFVLEASEPLTLVDSVAFGPAGVSATSLSVFLAYDTVAAPGQLYFSAAPLTFAIEAEVVEAGSQELFLQNISGPIIQGRCVQCHIPGGVAGGADILFARSFEADFQQTNYDALVSYVQQGQSATLINRPQGVAHPGGIVLQNGSAELANWIEFIQAIGNELGL